MTKNETKASTLMNELFENTNLWSTLEEVEMLLQDSRYHLTTLPLRVMDALWELKASLDSLEDSQFKVD